MRVLGLAAADLASSGGKNSEKRSTRMPTALAAAKWPNSCRMMSAAKPRKASSQLTVRDAPMQLGDATARASRSASYERLEGAHGRRRAGARAPLDDRRDAEEAQAAVEERVHGDLVGGVEHARRGAAGDRGLARQAQARERLGSTGSKVSAPTSARSSGRDRDVDAVGVVQRVGDRHAHVGVAEVRERRAVAQLDVARGRSTAGARRRRCGRTACRTGDGPRSARGPCSSASPSRS